MGKVSTLKRALLTGASGFIGCHALQPLQMRGFEVHAISSRLSNAYQFENGVHWHKADLLDNTQIELLVGSIQPSHLLHFAWYVETGKFWNSLLNLQWVSASIALLQAFIRYGGQRVVMTGTCVEYDIFSQSPFHETQTVVSPWTLYGASKHALHVAVRDIINDTNIRAAWGRAFLLYGPKEDHRRLVASVIRGLLKGEPVRCTHGNQVRDFLHAQDMADAFVALLDSEITGAVNIASGEAVTLKDLIYLIGEMIGRPQLIQLGALPASPNDPLALLGDTRRLREEVMWKPKYELKQGISATIDWWRSNL